ncbi:MAG: M50 family metallopeptidase [Candidatus Melainabacteria bacterium]|jgi:putative peptide zinc metalloprotease protein
MSASDNLFSDQSTSAHRSDSSQQAVQEAPQRIVLRSNLELTPFPDGSLQIRDPESVRYFHLGFDEAEIVKMLSSMHPLQIIERTSYTEAELKQFLGMLKQWGLLEGTTPPPRQAIRKMTALQFLFKRFELLDPNDLLTEWEPRLRWLGSNPFKYIFGALFLVSIVLAVKNFMSFATYGWPLVADSWSISLIVFITMLITVLAGHEICHGMVLKHFGGACHEMGFYFIYATPALYTDVSDVYKLPKAGQKIWVMMAGPVFQSVVGSVAFLLWSVAVPHTAIADLLFLLVTAAFFSLSINLNPLIRLDGYYALQLALSIHSLRRRAWAYVSAILTNKETEENLTERERKVFLLYAPLSVVYTCFVMVLTMSFYFQSTLLSFPAISAFIAAVLFVASQTDLPIKSSEEVDKS